MSLNIFRMALLKWRPLQRREPQQGAAIMETLLLTCAGALLISY
jgi:hypothetical protein